MSNDLADVYQEVIIDHVRHPHNYQRLESVTRTTEGVSLPWHDEFTVHLELNHGRTNDSALQGSRRAISHTSASRMTTVPAGRSEAKALALFGGVHAVLTEGSDDEVDLARLGSLAALSSMSECTQFGAPSTATAARGPGNSRG